MRKLFAAAISLVLLLAFAACGTKTEDPGSLGSAAPTVPVEIGFETVRFGSHDWVVLAREDGKMLLLTKDVIENAQFHTEITPVTWADCSLRAFLNGAFLESNFSEEERAKIVLTDCANGAVTFENGNGSIGGEDTQDKVFLLSYDEAVTLFSGDIQADESRRAAQADAVGRLGVTWWLRSPGDYINGFASVDAYGQVCYSNSNAHFGGLGLRPAIWVTE